MEKKDYLRSLSSVNDLIQAVYRSRKLGGGVPRELVTEASRVVLDGVREAIESAAWKNNKFSNPLRAKMNFQPKSKSVLKVSNWLGAGAVFRCGNLTINKVTIAKIKVATSIKITPSSWMLSTKVPASKGANISAAARPN